MTLSRKCPQVLCAGSDDKVPSEIFLLSQGQATPSASNMMTKSVPVSKGMPDHFSTLAAANPVAQCPIPNDQEVFNPTSVLRTSKKYNTRGLRFSKDSVYGSASDSDEEKKSYDLGLFS
jgi:hypothetical protein